MADILDRLKAALADRYRIERELGSGGMATVYLAHDLKHDRQVALKIMRPELSAILGGERFLREIRIAAKLNHPHILPLHDSGSADGFLYYVMPYVKGESLRAKIDREKQLSIDEALALTRQVASALDYAHQQGVIHRDVKPENILLHRGEAVVADFGIALAVTAAGGERLTETGLSLGTPEYMSPEQATGSGECDARTDVYSLGAVLYEMVTGEPPHTGATVQAVIAKLLSQPPVQPRAVRASVPEAMDGAIMKALAKDPADRFASAKLFAEAVRSSALSAPTAVRADRKAVVPVLAVIAVAAILVSMLAIALSRSPGSVGPPTLAALPFANMSGLESDEYFTAGIHEQILTQLSKVGGLSVRGLRSVLEYRDSPKAPGEIGQELNASYLLRGSVFREGQTVRITVHLIDAERDVQFWSETYDRDLSVESLLDVQSDIAQRVAMSLQAELTPHERARIEAAPTENLRAYNLYLLGQYHWNRFGQQDFDRSIDYFQQAITEDPGYAHAYAGLADAYLALALLHGTGETDPEEAVRRAKDAVARALEIDDELSEAHMVCGFIKHTFDYEYADAENELRRAIELSPSNAQAYTRLGMLLQTVGRHDEAIAAGRKAQELDPLSPIITTDLGWDLGFSGRIDEAVAQARAAIDRAPDFRIGHLLLCYALTSKGHYAAAIAACETAWRLSGNPADLARLAGAQALAGNESEVRRIEAQIHEIAHQRYVSPLVFGWLYAGIGEDDLAMDWLRQGVETRTGWITEIGRDPTFARLRTYPEFQELLARLNLR